MRLTKSSRFEQVGAVQIHELQRVIEFDSGSTSPSVGSDTVLPAELNKIESQMCIVILCMNEEFKTIEGVLSGIPHDCLIIFVSNSERRPVDRYQVEVRLTQSFCKDANRLALAIHQKDRDVAKAFVATGAAELVDRDGTIHNGKGEAMVIGMALAAMTNRRYVGFVDADNYIPGSVTEYCKVFAAGLHLAASTNAMVRVAWNSKPKERHGRWMFDKKGRSSRDINEWLNNTLQEHSGFGTEIIKTGNAGEHAMPLELGLKLKFAGGFAVEPYELIYLLENGNGQAVTQAENPPFVGEVHIHQIETRNPHLHDNKGEEHVQKMRFQALNMLYHSNITPEPIRNAIQDLMVSEEALAKDQEPAKGNIYPQIGSLDLLMLYDMLNSDAKSFHQITGESCACSYSSALGPIDRGSIQST
ncbi:putative mannosyl-3-phosphoglycerate synthase [Pseudomassariella vexata]|uniref:Putative mannosyl-3-phosphoglycerate synthase n=1 Tax=Pseudomassariella vexata TaxID=1141098 RepID=A0A1Y2DN39_9PEZI|nr:putative mannosyl-3-phosphoglycerate synthase [Pseudomassariella vexata]ORY60055.1 putative mannosyl-3-phosphoglycerate synthase [Pseudomassariella vexata]